MDFMELVEFKMQRNARERRRAERVRKQRIERMLSILFKAVVLASILMVMAGAGVIDAGRTITAEIYGALMMVGGFFVLGGCIVIYQEKEGMNGKL